MTEEELFTKGTDDLLWGRTAAALESFKKLVAIGRVPVYCSTLAFCLAKERGEIKTAVSLCNEAIRKEPRNSVHFLHLGRVFLIAGQKKAAIRAFRLGLRNERNREIIGELERLGTRMPPPISFLDRESPMNKYLGILLKRIGMRRRR